MSVTAPRGFRAAGVCAGSKSPGQRDIAVVVNDGPSRSAGGVFTENDDPAAPVLWSEQAVSGGRLRAVVLDSAAANSGTGLSGFQDVQVLAEHTAELLAGSAHEIALCAAGPTGTRPDTVASRHGVTTALGEAVRGGGLAAADALRTNDTVAKIAFQRDGGVTVGGMAKGPDPSVSTALCLLTTDADLTEDQCRHLAQAVTAEVFAPLTGTNDTVLCLASGSAEATGLGEDGVHALMVKVCADLAAQIFADPPTTNDKQAHT